MPNASAGGTKGGGGYGTAARYSRGVACADVAVGGGDAADLGDVNWVYAVANSKWPISVFAGRTLISTS